MEILSLVFTIITLSNYLDEDGSFGQEEVPLTVEIKEILEEYPDGQIFKVLFIVQYAMHL